MQMQIDIVTIVYHDTFQLLPLIKPIYFFYRRIDDRTSRI